MFSSYIVWYLFLAGVGSGSFIVAALCVLYDFRAQTLASQKLVVQSQNGFLIAVGCIIFASFFLFLDLGNPERAWQILLTPFNSIVATGAWCVILLAIVSCVVALCGFLQHVFSRVTLTVLMCVGILLAGCTMTYTGLLLSSMPSIDFWYTWLLVVLFIVSSLSTGLAAVLCSSAILPSDARVLDRSLWRFAGALGCLEIAVLVAFLFDRYHATQTAQDSCTLLFSGEYALCFWLGTVIFGLLVPLLLRIPSQKNPPAFLVLLASVGVLVGGLCLRYWIIGVALYTPMGSGFFS